jgi:glycosyltransferase involved in cell wall biosynthesis
VARVTVAIPTYNRHQWIGGAIESILGQTFEDFLLVVSDNASTDATPEVVAGYDDPRIVYRRLPENIGMLRNHNVVFGSIETEYFLIIPDDDRMKPDLLARTVEVLDAHPRAGMVHTGFDTLAGDGRVVVRGGNWTNGLTDDAVETGMEFIRESMLYSCRVCASSALTRTAALPPTFFEEADFPAIDFGMWLRMAAGWDMAFIADSLAEYSIHGGSHSAGAGIGTPMQDGYIQGFDLIDRHLEMKRRFLALYGDRLEGDTRELEALARTGYRREVLLTARNATVPERRLRPTVRALSTIVRHEPAMLHDVRVWRLLAASVIGGRNVERIKARRARRAGVRGEAEREREARPA